MSSSLYSHILNNHSICFASDTSRFSSQHCTGIHTDFSPTYNLLTTFLHQSSLSKMSPSLPTEILFRVCDFLRQSRDHSTLRNFRQASKTFCAVASVYIFRKVRFPPITVARLVKKLEFLLHPSSSLDILKYIKSAHYIIREWTSIDAKGRLPDLLIKFLRRCPNLIRFESIVFGSTPEPFLREVETIGLARHDLTKKFIHSTQDSTRISWR